MTDERVELIDHTGDAGLRITAGSLPRLLAVSAQQMVRICCPEGVIRRSLARPVTVTGDDLVELFVNWLSEINSLMSVHHELYGSFTIKEISDLATTPLHLTGSAEGEPIAPERHLLACEIKAVTFHTAYVCQVPSGWQCQVIFDL
jgi:SHS2 domain-containing protein